MLWNISRGLVITPVLLQLNASHRTVMNTGYEEHITKTKILGVGRGNSKLVSEAVKELQKQLQTVKIFSDDVYMEFVRDNCAKIVHKKGKLVHSQNLLLDISREIQQLERGKTYWCLGTEEREGIQHQQMKEGSKGEYAGGLRTIPKI